MSFSLRIWSFWGLPGIYNSDIQSFRLKTNNSLYFFHLFSETEHDETIMVITTDSGRSLMTAIFLVVLLMTTAHASEEHDHSHSHSHSVKSSNSHSHGHDHKHSHEHHHYHDKKSDDNGLLNALLMTLLAPAGPPPPPVIIDERQWIQKWNASIDKNLIKPRVKKNKLCLFFFSFCLLYTQKVEHSNSNSKVTI